MRWDTVIVSSSDDQRLAEWETVTEWEGGEAPTHTADAISYVHWLGGVICHRPHVVRGGGLPQQNPLLRSAQYNTPYDPTDAQVSP